MASPRSRRDVLKLGSAAGSLALAGCQFGHGRESFPTIQIESDPVPGEWGVEIDVTIENQFGWQRPARLRITFTNTADYEREFSFGKIPPFVPLDGEHASSDARLQLYPVHPHQGVDTYNGSEAPAAIPSRPEDGCWRATDYIAIELGYLHVTLSPGEEIGETYAVLAHPDSSTCLAAGDYRFEDRSITPTGDKWVLTVTVSPPSDG